MANILAPFGFQKVGSKGGATPAFGYTPRRIASNNNTAIGYGDPVTLLTTGYITRATAGTSSVNGIFMGCQYYSASQNGRPMWSRYWPGTDATGDVIAYVEDDPNSLYRVQASGASAIAFADIGANINFAIGTVNTMTGYSGATVDQATVATTATHPFRIVDLVRDPAGANGTDTASAYNFILVRPNNFDARGTTGI